MNKVVIKAPNWDKIVNERFLELIDNKDRHLLMYGSRASSKSYFSSEMLIDRCLTWKHFRCVCIRKEVSKNADSTHKMLIETIKNNGYESLFKITYSPNMRIKCINGNEFIFRGMDNIDNIKSLVDVTTIYFEEEVPDTEEDFETVSLTMRSNKAPFLQILYTINPTINDHENHWFWKKWFEGETSLSFKKKIQIEGENGEIYEEIATIHHSTYLDNRWCDKNTYAALQLLKLKDPYVYATQGLGLWSSKVPEGRFWKHFDIGKHTGNVKYDSNYPIHLSFDFNKNPGMHVGIYQVIGKNIYQVDELSLKNPNNRTSDACETILNRYRSHTSGVYIYGDPNGYQESSATKAGFNNFSIIFDMLKVFNTQDRTIRKAPAIAKSAEWINEIFFSQLDGIKISINEKCNISVNDFMNAQEAPDGTMMKPKIKDKETGLSYERLGHMSDLFRYFMTSCFYDSYNKWKDPMSGFKPIMIDRQYGRNRI